MHNNLMFIHTGCGADFIFVLPFKKISLGGKEAIKLLLSFLSAMKYKSNYLLSKGRQQKILQFLAVA